MKFAIAIEPGDKGHTFGVVVPDLPGCFSAGDTLNEALSNARQAIAAHCETLTANGEAIPQAKPLEEWKNDSEFAGWGLVFV